MQLKSLLSYTALPLIFLCSSKASPDGGLTEWEQVHQKLNLYPLIVDGHLWDLIPDLFAEDAFANYTGFQPNAKGIKAITKGLQNAVVGFDTQHHLGTTRINVSPDMQTAKSTIYVIATLWTKPQQTSGQYAAVYGYYEDHLRKTSEGWRIQNRVFALIGPGLSGNLTILGL